MKALFLSIFLLFSFFLLQSNSASVQIQGTVVDNDNIPLVGANIQVKETSISTITDIDGTFKIDMPVGKKALFISYSGYQPKEINVVKSKLLIVLEKNKLHPDVILSDEYNKEPSGYITGSSTKDKSIVAAFRSMERTSTSSTLGTPMAEYKSFSEHVSIDLPSAGQMTAGEWNDLNNWEDWNNLINEGEYKSMSRYWGIYPDDRYSVFITNKENYPIVNAQVDLISKSNNIIWTTMTDNTGKAELWNNISEDKQKVDKIRISKNGITKNIKEPVAIDQGTNHINTDLPCVVDRSVDIAFIVDATGSMGDEINFLKSELTDIFDRLAESNHKTNYRTASVFYKDHNEDYLTTISGLSDDISKTNDFIKTKSAGGGGDTEEAVEEGIQEALALDWNSNATARLAFLILDAAPHHTPEIIEKLQLQVTEAAQRGIKLIPITASGIDRQGEFLMKYLSIITNGTYVFITDDSGIGGSHLKPLVDNYEVEKLNDLIFRLIQNYGNVESCQNTKRNDDNINVNIFPNPASEYINVELSNNADRIILRSSSGKIVLQVQEPKKGINKIGLDNLVGGLYTVQAESGNKIIFSKSVIIIN